MTRALMFQGTGSDVGKSLIVAGLCRAYARRGIRVSPFKPQNMSNNAAAVQGGEIGRAQWLQAFAAGIIPNVHMNPVLLKPQSDRSSQVVVQGQVRAEKNAYDYQAYRVELMDAVLESYHTLAREADLILVEGAGSPAEINLRENDIANMGFAQAARCPVVLIGDINRGGVIASIAGTHTVLPPEDRGIIKAFLINRFRGDASLFGNGMTSIESHTGWRGMGILPHFPPLTRLPQEDALGLEIREPHKNVIPGLTGNPEQQSVSTALDPRLRGDDTLHIVLPVWPRLSNFDDIDPLRGEPNVRVTLLREGEVLPADTDLVILAGSKSTLDDLAYLRAQGWDTDIIAHHRRGGHVLGLCGGYQMLGTSLTEQHRSAPGLGLLQVETVFHPAKQVSEWQGRFADTPVTARGYEIHTGVTTGLDTARPLLQNESGTPEGAVSADGRVCGTYVHGFFTEESARAHYLARLGLEASSEYRYWQHMRDILDSWADVLEECIDLEALLTMAAPVNNRHPRPRLARSGILCN